MNLLEAPCSCLWKRCVAVALLGSACAVSADPPEDLRVVSDATFAALDGLAEGSAREQEIQRQDAGMMRMALEVETRRLGMRLRFVPSLSALCVPRWNDRDDSGHREILGMDRALYVAKYEVTQGQWLAVMGTNPATFSTNGLDRPVETVSWYEAQAFADALCRLEGVAKGTYRLLTANEWEYASRAGAVGDLYVFLPRGRYDFNLGLNRVAWNAQNTSTINQDKQDWSYEDTNERWHCFDASVEFLPDFPRPVGQKVPNAFGLYDTLGNVAEWLCDISASSNGFTMGGHFATTRPLWKKLETPLGEQSRYVGLRVAREVNYGRGRHDFHGAWDHRTSDQSGTK